MSGKKENSQKAKMAIFKLLVLTHMHTALYFHSFIRKI